MKATVRIISGAERKARIVDATPIIEPLQWATINEADSHGKSDIKLPVFVRLVEAIDKKGTLLPLLAEKGDMAISITFSNAKGEDVLALEYDKVAPSSLHVEAESGKIVLTFTGAAEPTFLQAGKKIGI